MISNLVLFLEWSGAAPLAIFISTSIGGCVAFWAVITQRKLAREKNSHDIIMDVKSDKKLADSIILIRGIVEDDEDSLVNYAKESANHKCAAISIRYFLNFHESLSVGIDRGIYDEQMLRDNWETRICRMWDDTEDYIKKRRNLGHQSKAYEHYEALATRWAASPTSPRAKGAKLK